MPKVEGLILNKKERRREKKDLVRKKMAEDAARRKRRLLIFGGGALGLTTLLGVKSYYIDREPPINLPKPDPSKYETTSARFISSGPPPIIRERLQAPPALDREYLKQFLATLRTTPEDG